MSIENFTQYFSLAVAIICFGVGFAIKHLAPVSNRIIPAVNLALGIALALLMYGLSVDSAAIGVFSAFASTGLYEFIKQWIKKELGVDLDDDVVIEEDDDELEEA